MARRIMCGIVGIVHRDNVPVSQQVVRRMADSIRHRGPDEDGFFCQGPVGLGMRRLSVIDLAGGHQPVTNEDGSVLMVFNGEIYNYRGLRDGLIARGHTMRTHSDTETIVHLYEEMGDRCVEPLRGMFAFALWDAKKSSLLLARDRFGIKPLYLADHPWGLAFASELKALHAAGLAGRELDWDALDMYFQLGYIPAPFSPLRGVRKLLPGHTMTWSNGTVTERRYWDLPRGREAAPADPEARVREWLDDSIHAHLESDVPVAAFLSGGMDSSAIVSSMALANHTPHAFTVRYAGSANAATDESGLARMLANRYGAELTVVDVDPSIRDIFEPIVQALDEPHADESAMPTWLISQAVASQFKVALAGTGGDELFAGYRRHLGLLLGGAYSALPPVIRRVASRVADTLPEPRGAGLGVNRLKRFLRVQNQGVPDQYLEMLTRLGDTLRGNIYAPSLRAVRNEAGASAHFRRLFADLGPTSSLSAALYFDYKTYLPDDLLALADRLSMAHSLELRVPFVDHVLVEHVFPLPDRLKVGRFQNKRLLRNALRPRLPDAHFHAPKRGFVGPVAAWLRNELRDLITDELSADRLKRLGFFRSDTIQEFLDDHLSRRHNRSGILWALLCFMTWHRLYLETPAVAPYTPGAGVS